MKKYLLSLFCLLTVFGANALINSGTILLGGDANFNVSSRKYYYGDGTEAEGDITSTSISFNPTVGIFLNSTFAIGFKGGITKVWDKNGFNNRDIENNTELYSFGSFARYYKKLGTQAGFFAQAEAIYSKGSQNFTRLYYGGGNPIPQNQTNNISGFVAGIRPGFVYFITPRLGLETTIGFFGFTRQTQEDDENNIGIENKTNSFGFSLNSSTVNFGLRWYLGKK